MKTAALLQTIKIPLKTEDMQAAQQTLAGEIYIPAGATAMVLFAHGIGSNRHSPRNRFTANVLHDQNIATLLLDFFTDEDENACQNRFNIDMLAERLLAATSWLQEQGKFFKLGYFGSNIGAAVALKAAAELGNEISAVVTRGGRPDLAIPEIKEVKAPVLFIVGELDHGILELNRKAFGMLNTVKELKIINDATHLFEEPGTLDEVSVLAAEWFAKYLSK